MSKYFEFDLFDYKKADKVFRVGQQHLEDIDKESQNISSLYYRFSMRMNERIKNDIAPRITKLERGEYQPRAQADGERIKNRHEQVYRNSRKSYTKNQIWLGGIPIYVDPEFRDDVIPEATVRVECFYDCLKVLDGYTSVQGTTDNFFVQ